MAQTETWTIQRLMEWTRDFLAKKGVEEPRLACELLLAHAMGLRKIDLYTRYHETVPPDALDSFRELVRRAAAHEPIAYLVGYREFFSLNFAVSGDVLIPRPETETLVGEVIHTARQRGQDPAGLRILDIGAGSGAIAVALAVHLKGATIIATDVSEPALAVARKNAAAHNVQIDFRLGSLYEPLAGEPPFDYICSNPPYIAADELTSLPANVREYEPHAALSGGADGLEVIRPLIAGASERLAEGGMLFIEVAYNQADRVLPMLAATGGLDQARAIRDSLGHQRVVAANRV